MNSPPDQLRTDLSLYNIAFDRGLSFKISSPLYDGQSVIAESVGLFSNVDCRLEGNGNQVFVPPKGGLSLSPIGSSHRNSASISETATACDAQLSSILIARFAFKHVAVVIGLAYHVVVRKVDLDWPFVLLWAYHACDVLDRKSSKRAIYGAMSVSYLNRSLLLIV
jgi:hypothetical protein